MEIDYHDRMIISNFHTFLETDGLWASFYPHLEPKDMQALVLTDRHSKMQVERLYPNLYLIGQIFRNRIIQLNDKNFLNDCISKNRNNFFMLNGISAAITAAISDQQLDRKSVV